MDLVRGFIGPRKSFFHLEKALVLIIDPMAFFHTLLALTFFRNGYIA